MRSINWARANLKCVIMCGGKSSRFASAGKHKSMAAIDDVPLLRYVIDYWRRYASQFVFVVKNGKADVIDYVRQLPIEAEFIEPEALRGIADGLRQVQPLIDAPFITVLGDCFCSGDFDLSNQFEYGVGVQARASPDTIRRNFSVEVSGDRILRLEEKPQMVANRWCGLGYYFFQPDIFEYIRLTTPSARTGEIEITDVLQTLVNQGIALYPAMFDGLYVNVNTPSDLDSLSAQLNAGTCLNPLRLDEPLVSD